jgi:hypothetical protein
MCKSALDLAGSDRSPVSSRDKKSKTQTIALFIVIALISIGVLFQHLIIGILLISVVAIALINTRINNSVPKAISRGMQDPSGGPQRTFGEDVLRTIGILILMGGFIAAGIIFVTFLTCFGHRGW